MPEADDRRPFKWRGLETDGVGHRTASFANPTALAQDGTVAKSCISKLMGKLTLHLGKEDKLRYPELMAHKNASVAAMAKRLPRR